MARAMGVTLGTASAFGAGVDASTADNACSKMLPGVTDGTGAGAGAGVAAGLSVGAKKCEITPTLGAEMVGLFLLGRYLSISSSEFMFDAGLGDLALADFRF